MGGNQTEGTAKRAKGSVKEAIGKLTGNPETQAEGAAEKAAGEMRGMAGGAGDTPHDAPEPRR
jgi:uncharacterized protein YjbJ (UPF0337 family)